HEVGGIRKQKLSRQIGARPGYQRFAASKIEFDFDPARLAAALQRQNGLNVSRGHLAAVTGRRDHNVRVFCHAAA
ncbi:MAG: hypothetical protein WA384_00725, partial [Rhodomicrobium sp.]